jgi:hypothetical protein
VPKRNRGRDQSSTRGSGSAQPRVATQPTKQERREEARRERERIRKQAQRRWRYARLGTVLAAIALVFGVVYLVTRPGARAGATLTAQERQLLKEAPDAARTSGCGPIHAAGAYDPSSEDGAHIGLTIPNAPPLSSYPSQPPASGPHDPTPLDAGVYSSPPPIYQAIHSLEHGAVVIWYDPSLPTGDLKPVTGFFSSPALQDHLIVVPYQYPGPGGSLPPASKIVLVAWHTTRSCAHVSLPVAFDFVAHYRTPTIGGLEYQGEAPEAGAEI